ncbi:MAG: SusC/RagA family TonB-linked outer membrane protein [Candidatus Cryptobacteroides sp.]
MSKAKIHNYCALIITLLLSLSNLSVTFAQNIIEVRGRVTDVDSQPLIGVVVMSVDDKANAAITDENGDYVISLKSGQSIEFNYIGYITERMTPKSSVCNISMREDAIQLSEATVIGYGEVRKETLTGAVSSVSTDDLLKSPSPNIGNMLMGQVAGLSTISTTGAPGADNPEIFVRGIGTLNASNAKPLMLVDGVERDFFQMDPNEIESISVLKDASATAVFGVQGANGVIIVTTRRGVEGAPKISVSLSGGVQVPLRVMKLADSYEFGIAYNEMMGSQVFTDEVLDKFKTGSDPLIYPSHDWVKELTRKATFQTQDNINISGGTKHVKYFASLGYMSQDGIMKKLLNDVHDNYKYNRYNYRVNFDIQATNSTSLSISLGGVAGQRQEPRNTSGGVANLWRNIYWGVPYAAAGVIDGKLIRMNSRYIPGAPQTSPFDGWFGKGSSNYSTNSLNLDLILTQKLNFITDGLNVKLKYSYMSDYTHKKERTYSVPTYTPWRIGDTTAWEQVDPDANPDEIVLVKNGEDAIWGYNESYSNKSRKYYWELSLNYARKFGKHNVSALLLGNLKKRFYLPSQYNYQDIPLGSMGIVGRVAYNYNQKYLFEFNFGYNGSENFAEGQRFGLFPALSLGWVLTEERFMKENVRFFSFLKLRASVGKVGSDYVGQNRFLYLPDTWNPDATGYGNGFIFGTANNASMKPGAVENSLGNPDVTWETAIKQNYGIDLSVLRGRLGLNADLFFEHRTGILAKRNNVPAYVAANLPVANIGIVDNHGWELVLKWKDDFAAKKGHYWITATTSFNRNKIVYMDEIKYDYARRQRTGHPVGQYFGLVYEGLYKSSDFPEAQKYGSFLAPGDMKFTDMNYDGVIDANDEAPIRYSRYPEYVLSLNLGVSFKGFDISMLWQGATNVSKEYSTLYRVPFTDSGKNALMYYVYRDRFVSEELTPDASYPRLANEARGWNYNNQLSNSYWVKDASYLRLKNAEVGYTVKSKSFKKAGINNFRVYLRGSNLLTFDGLKYIDPEERAGSGSKGEYPNVAVVNIGINLNF